MEVMCANCPFAKSGEGRKLARSLAPGRMAEIKRGLLRGETFHCHKTTLDTDEGDAYAGSTSLLCAGALAWQNARGASSNYQRVCESLDYFAAQRKAKSLGRSALATVSQ